MALDSGVRLGAYEILDAIGEGGMGQVYRARDTRLDRIVAIKVLPERFADDPQRRERFEREARAVAALNHPHICQLYDVGEAAASPAGGAQRFLVMEYLEGQTLEDRLVPGPLPVAVALGIAIDLADALDHAHRRGLVHRDLKPANVMLTTSGGGSAASPQAKLLDFGISRLQPRADLPALETVTTDRGPLTADGAVIGTYPYMSPEQLQGREADARSDLFAFGALLYEMIAGQRAFQGTTAATLIGAILHGDPPAIASRQPAAPPALDRVIARCLAKDPDNRWQTARDLALELRWIVEHPAATAGEGARRWSRGAMVAAAAIAAALVIAVAASTGAFLRAEPDPAPVRMALDPVGEAGSGASQMIGPVIISPDGRQLVYALDSADGRRQLWLRTLDSLNPRALAGTEGGAYPFWSPDSRWIGFFARDKLLRIAVDRGPAQILSDAREPRGGSWSTGSEILFAANAGREMYRIAAGGGLPTPLPADGLNLERLHPSFLPDGRHFVYAGRPQERGVFLGSLDSPAVTRLLEDYSAVAYLSPGSLLLLRGASEDASAQTLLAQRFDADSRTLVGTPEPLENSINFDSRQGLGYFSASGTGTLVYSNPDSRAMRLTWFDRSGAEAGQVGAPGSFVQPALSPDDGTIAVQREDPETHASDLWTIDAASGLGQRLTHGSYVFMPVWSPDGTRVAYSSRRGSFPPNLFVTTLSASGVEQRLVESPDLHHPTDWSRDGRFVIYATQHAGTGWDLMKLPMTGPESARRPESVLATPFNEHFGRVSPDGRWLAYASDESGAFEVFVQPFTGEGPARRVSVNGGLEPVWRRDGSEIYYVAPGGVLMAASVDRTSAATFRTGEPRLVFQGATAPRIGRTLTFVPTYRVSSDGTRFLLTVFASEMRTTPTKILFNWPAALSRP